MRISTTIVHTVTFSVRAFWSEEGGMGQDSFGPSCDTLIEALVHLDLANAQDPKTDWLIVCSTAKQVQQGKQPT